MSGAFLTSFRYAPRFEPIGIESRWGPPDLDQMSQYTLQLVGILDDGDDFHLRPALRAGRRLTPPVRPCIRGGRAMYSAGLSCAGSSRIRTLLSMLNPECFQDRRFRAKSSFRSLRSTRSVMTRRRKTSTIDWSPENGMKKNVPSSSNPPSRTTAWKCGFHRSISPTV